MARPSNTAERRAQIADALVRVMARRGYDGASTSAIAEEAGLAQGLVHYHFNSKNEILVEAVEDLVRRFQLRYETKLAAAGDDPRARIFAFVDAHLELGPDADARTVAAWVVIGSEAVSDKSVRRIFSRTVRTRMRELERLLRACLRAEGRSTHEMKWLAAAVMSAIEGCYQLSAAAPGVMPRGYAAPTVRAMVAGLIGTRALPGIVTG